MRFLIMIFNIGLSFLAWAISECVLLSKSAALLAKTAAEIDRYQFVTVTTFNFFKAHIPVYTFDIGGMLKVFGNEFSDLYLKLQLKMLIPFAIGLGLLLILHFTTVRIPALFYNRKTTLHGSSRWMTEKEMRKTGLLRRGSGFVLGETREAEFAEVKGEQILDRPGEIISQNGNAHTLVVGSTRSGKGVSCIIPTEFNWSDSMIVLDPKAEGWGISANHRAKFSYTFKFEPEKPHQSIHYNPLLSIRRGRQTMPDIQNLAFILIPLNENSKEPFWDNEARKLLSAVIGYVIYCEPPENKTFRHVYSIFTAPMEDVIKPKEESEDNPFEQQDDPNESAVKKYLRQYAENVKTYRKRMEVMPEELEREFLSRTKLSKAERAKVEAESQKYLTRDDMETLNRIQQDLAYFAGCEDRQLSSVVSTMMSNLHVIADPNVQEVTDRSDFVMEDFVQGVRDESGRLHPMSLYICVSLSSMKRLMPLIRMFYEQAITLLTRDLRKNPYKLLLVFDEFYQMGRMDIVEKTLSISAGYGVLCAVVIQSYDQLQKLYQSEATFTDNFAYQVILRVNEQKTCEKVSAMLGKETKKHRKMGTSGNVYALGTNATNFNTEQMGRELMTAEEVRTMPDDDCLIFASGKHPYKARKIRYYLDDRFRRLYLDGAGNILPAPETPEAIEDNQPHPDAVETYEVVNGDRKETRYRRIGIDDEGWHLLLGFNAQVLPFELKEMDTTPSGETVIEEETIGSEEMQEIEPVNEIDSQFTAEEVKDLMGVTDFADDAMDSLSCVLEHYRAEKEMYEMLGIA